MEESSGGISDRLRGAARGARERITGTADVITGVQSRRQWEAFTDAVTRTVVGVHRDQEELRKTQEELETRYEALRLEFDAMSSEIKAHSVQLMDIRRLWVGVLGVGAVAMGALVLGVIALVRSF